MDRYLFRGKRVDNGKLVEGWLFQNKHRINKYFIRHFPDKDDYYEDCAVFKETICQCTGLKDKNGKLIFEGDIVKANGFNPKSYEIKFIEGAFCASNPILDGYPIDISTFYPSIGCQLEIIGNIHDKVEV